MKDELQKLKGQQADLRKAMRQNRKEARNATKRKNRLVKALRKLLKVKAFSSRRERSFVQTVQRLTLYCLLSGSSCPLLVCVHTIVASLRHVVLLSDVLLFHFLSCAVSEFASKIPRYLVSGNSSKADGLVVCEAAKMLSKEDLKLLIEAKEAREAQKPCYALCRLC